MRYFTVMLRGSAVILMCGQDEEEARKRFAAEWGQSKTWRKAYQEWVEGGAVLVEKTQEKGAR